MNITECNIVKGFLFYVASSYLRYFSFFIILDKGNKVNECNGICFFVLLLVPIN